MKLTYLSVDIAAVLVPFIFSFHPKIKFHKEYKYFWPSNIAVAIVFLVWDFLFTDFGVWGFNPKYITGVYLFNLPIEEVAFFICIPYACVFTYHCFKTLYAYGAILSVAKYISTFLIAVLSVTGFYFIDRLYTSATFILLAITIWLLQFIFKAQWLGRFYFTYMILLIPFLIVNGILTGTGLDEPVVWYNNNENSGIRLMTIPVEDVFYGMLLVILNVAGFEKLKLSFNKLSNVHK